MAKEIKRTGGGPWSFWIDRGGTFTDVVARDPEGRIHVRKLLSDHPALYEDAPLHAIEALLGVDPGHSIPPGVIAAVKMGTTLATNALLERKGAKVGLLITKGFADLLEIGYQDRPDLFALDIQKSETLAARIIEIDERILADGEVRCPLNQDEVRQALAQFNLHKIESVAVLFLHSFAHPLHELAAEVLAFEAGFQYVSLSHRVAREIKAVGRGDTTMADAYLTPLLRRYVSRLRQALGPHVPVRFMQSHGGLTGAENFSGKNALLSGPAGGVVAYARVCTMAGIEKAIGFDMGGTSTDVSRFDGSYERTFETQVAGVRIKAPMLNIETVAAGGGSVLDFDGRRFLVGPESAGADPGPACYRNGGPATVTDANLVLGRIQPHLFPACFGSKASEPLDPEASFTRLRELGDRVAAATGKDRSVEAVAAGFVRIANENMAGAIKKISVARGYDVQEYALACFGGAGPQHACAIAESLGITTIFIHPLAGVLSAYGMGLADTAHTTIQPVLEPLSESTAPDLEPRFESMEAEGEALLSAEGFDGSDITHLRTMDLRYVGVDAYLNVTAEDAGDAFLGRHKALYGYLKKDHPIEVVNIRVESIGHTEKPDEPEVAAPARLIDSDRAIGVVRVHFDEPKGGLRAVDTAVYMRDSLEAGHWLEGPALIAEEVSTIIVDPRWKARVNGRGHLILWLETTRERERVPTDRDPVMLEVFNNLFMSIADQMGETLERVSHSANIKERRDFSCAVFSAEGELVANAHHIPVHLGAMAESVRAILRVREGETAPGEVYATNDPYNGGSHLPDVTVVTPVFAPSGERIFLVANRGHHADIGGIAPGSMPPLSKSIEEEGVIFHNLMLVSNGRFHEDSVAAVLRSGPYPARNMEERMSDLRAQIAANVAGARLLQELCERYGPEAVTAYMGHVRRNAAEAMEELIRDLGDGVYSAEDYLDCGAKIACTITIEGAKALVDFEGTSPLLDGNLNAPPAVTIAAVLYAFRALVQRPVPLNGGCLDPITIRIPRGSLLSPSHPAAVVGGNVETSNRIVDVLYKALNAVAASQGTMNNLTFGTAQWGYYETICGGAGAGPGFHGASAVHTHMTNTRITDPEVLECRYPVILRQFAIRRDTGGQGQFRGGDGVIRSLEFREALSVGILSQRRVYAPYGINGAASGAVGRNTIERDGRLEELPGQVSLEVKTGDVLSIETPGGGGFNY